MPDHQLKVSFRKVAPAQLRRDHDRYVNGVLFRAIGECFAALGGLNQIAATATVSGRDPATAQMQESVRLKVVVERLQWCKTDFARLADLEPAKALHRFV